MQDIVDRLLATTPGLTRNGLANLADLPPSTVKRVAEGTAPRLSTLEALSGAVGYDLVLALEPVQDTLAGEALLAAMGELPSFPSHACWEALIARAPNLGAALHTIAPHSQVPLRPGAVLAHAGEDAIGVIDAAYGRHRWLVSGGQALTDAGYATTAPMVVYTDQIDRAAAAVAADPGPTPVWLLPMDEGAWRTRQVLSARQRYVSVPRALLDAAGLAPAEARTLGEEAERRG
ncbi:MAG: hypothetical protein LBS27_10545 [Bifidobacteriaceae bacterium]|nr:hypothetical protein [Bifidobacteriaceae bacterium]